jgi:hypothetical protein
MARATTRRPDYDRHEELLVQLHRLIAAGEGDTDGADRLRDEMERCWWSLTPSEQARLEALSGDLYQLSGREILEPTSALDSRPRGRPDGWEGAVRRAVDRGAWDRVLTLLRSRERDWDAAQVARLRGIAWHQMGRLVPSEEFLRFSLALDPTSGFTRYVLLEVLAERDTHLAIAEALEWPDGDGDDCWWLVKLFTLMEPGGPSHGVETWRRVQQRLDEALHRRGTGGGDQWITLSLLALGHASLNAEDAARAEWVLSRVEDTAVPS